MKTQPLNLSLVKHMLCALFAVSLHLHMHIHILKKRCFLHDVVSPVLVLVVVEAVQYLRSQQLARVCPVANRVLSPSPPFTTCLVIASCFKGEFIKFESAVICNE